MPHHIADYVAFYNPIVGSHLPCQRRSLLCRLLRVRRHRPSCFWTIRVRGCRSFGGFQGGGLRIGDLRFGVWELHPRPLAMYGTTMGFCGPCERLPKHALDKLPFSLRRGQGFSDRVQMAAMVTPSVLGSCCVQEGFGCGVRDLAFNAGGPACERGSEIRTCV